MYIICRNNLTRPNTTTTDIKIKCQKINKKFTKDNEEKPVLKVNAR